MFGLLFLLSRGAEQHLWHTCVLGSVIVQFVRARAYWYSLYTIVARSCIVVVMTALYVKAHAPLFLV
jgi:hypothetical protein